MNAPVCAACGTCCRKGGPVLHREDSSLLRSGLLPLAALLTLRPGELVWDAVREEHTPLSEDAIKLAGSGSGWSCPCLDATACSIYAERPAQCRALFCTDSSALAAMYATDRLARADVLPLLHADWLPLAQAHEAECAFSRLAPLAMRACRDAGAESALLEAVRFDQAFRELAVERAAVPEDALRLLFGRPLRALLAGFGLAVAGGGARLVRSGLSMYPCREQ